MIKFIENNLEAYLLFAYTYGEMVLAETSKIVSQKKIHRLQAISAMCRFTHLQMDVFTSYTSFLIC